MPSYLSSLSARLGKRSVRNTSYLELDGVCVRSAGPAPDASGLRSVWAARTHGTTRRAKNQSLFITLSFLDAEEAALTEDTGSVYASGADLVASGFARSTPSRGDWSCRRRNG